MHRRDLIVFTISLGVSLAPALLQSAQQSAPFKITTKRDGDKVKVSGEPDKAIFSVISPSGIGQVEIERADEQWPGSVVVRLCLNGLESFRASNGKTTLNAAVSSSSAKPQSRLWKDGKEEAPLEANSPYWMEVRLINGDDGSAATIPPSNRYFELLLPAAFFENNPKSITLNWIDFYRN